ncbi:hypothetical protein CPB86DRAFT_788356 [Serendipita vermifera]|nr:hypothetical protein CPB86DRAFT_788356 [Serendipita vermifera]
MKYQGLLQWGTLAAGAISEIYANWIGGYVFSQLRYELSLPFFRSLERKCLRGATSVCSGSNPFQAVITRTSCRGRLNLVEINVSLASLKFLSQEGTAIAMGSPIDSGR